ncbi:hypothetical protein E3N88_34715 [Mikania micrantha]|uniref:Choline transporter-like protein n=1 Tax=Mikania micrantha TaxID=192012 RepID=A0A5N6LYY6_9ASTR|nr:hypothetical protein E3N88_34715 [Mikania micrantha]
MGGRGVISDRSMRVLWITAIGSAIGLYMVAVERQTQNREKMLADILNDAISPIIGEHDPYYHVSATEQHHIRAVAFLMTCVMIVAVLSSTAIVRPILMATSVLKATSNDCNTNCCAYDLNAKRVSCDDCCGYSIHHAPHIAASILFHFFGCYWATQFIIACSSTVIAGSVASYYWTRGESSFCMKCIELSVKSVNRNAYIMIAITGKGFFKASEMATDLIISNILRIGRVNVIGDVILFLGKLCVSLASALFAFLMLDTYKYKSSHNKITSPLFPMLVLVEMSIDTIILSYCKDADEHQGIAHYAPPLLIETFDEQNETPPPPSIDFFSLTRCFLAPTSGLEVGRVNLCMPPADSINSNNLWMRFNEGWSPQSDEEGNDVYWNYAFNNLFPDNPLMEDDHNKDQEQPIVEQQLGHE